MSMGIHRQRRADEVFEVDVVGGQTILNMARIDKVLLTGYLAGILKYEILTYLVMDGVLPSGVTKVYVDSNNLLPFTGHFMYNPESFLRPLCIVVSPVNMRKE